MSDQKAQCIILNKFFTDSKHKYTRRVRLIVRESVNCFCEQLLQESWNDVFSTNDVNNSFNKFLNIILTIYEASFPYKYLSKDQDKGWITQGIRKSCQRKRSLYNISKNNDNLMIRLYYKSYCSILRRVIREAKKYILRIYLKHQITKEKQYGPLLIEQQERLRNVTIYNTNLKWIILKYQ